MSLNHTSPGFGFVAEYAVAAIPYVTGSISLTTTPLRIPLPKISKYIEVSNVSGAPVRVGFTSNGVNGGNYFSIQSGSIHRFDVRMADLFVRSDVDTSVVDIFAGLTVISRNQMPQLSGSWEGIG